MRDIIRKLEEAASLTEAEQSLGGSVVAVFTEFMKRTAQLVAAELKGKEFAGLGFQASAETGGFEWPVVIIADPHDETLFHLEMACNTDDGRGTLSAWTWEGASPGDDKTVTLPLGGITPAKASALLIDLVRKNLNSR